MCALVHNNNDVTAKLLLTVISTWETCTTCDRVTPIKEIKRTLKQLLCGNRKKCVALLYNARREELSRQENHKKSVQYVSEISAATRISVWVKNRVHLKGFQTRMYTIVIPVSYGWNVSRQVTARVCVKVIQH